MSTQNARRLRKKESRARQTELCHYSTFISEYIKVKYNEIYKEADSFYHHLNKQYPNKRKLTTTNEYKVWEAQTKKQKEPTTTTTSQTSVQNNPEHTDNIEINVQLMNHNDVQNAKDMLMFEGINPSLSEEINDDIIREIIQDIQENDIYDIFNTSDLQPTTTTTDEDLSNDELNHEINVSLNELSALEKELLNY